MTDLDRQRPNFVQQGFDFVKTALRQVVQQNSEDEYWAGFARAAGISHEIVQKKLDALEARMTSGSLTKAEQVTHAQLKALRTELEEGFDDDWEGSDADWRPTKRGTTRRQEPSAEQ